MIRNDQNRPERSEQQEQLKGTPCHDRGSIEELEKSKIKKGDILEGKVTKNTTYGSFVSLGKGRSGLIHSSNLDVKLTEGERIDVKVTNIKGDKYDLILK